MLTSNDKNIILSLTFNSIDFFLKIDDIDK